mgnify:CR=1 FL=1
MARKRVLAIASGGGHWVQLMRLRPAFEGQDVTWISRDPASASDVAPAPFLVIGEASRAQRLGVLKVIIQALWLMIMVRHCFLVTTGAAPGLAARFADIRLTQWPDLVEEGVKHWGAVL